jgi:hypothetical protein
LKPALSPEPAKFSPDIADVSPKENARVAPFLKNLMSGAHRDHGEPFRAMGD